VRKSEGLGSRSIHRLAPAKRASHTVGDAQRLLIGSTPIEVSNSRQWQKQFGNELSGQQPDEIFQTQQRK
jgi:hypothetical protein